MKEKMNGSTDLLAKAMRRVFQEAVEEGNEPLRKEVGNLREEMHDGFREVNQRLQDHDRQFEKIDARFDKVDQTLENHGKRIGNLEEKSR